MTKIQIIIDGVDVNECLYLINKVCIDDPNYVKECQGHNCYYKMLQRLRNQYDEVIEQNKNLQAELREKTLELNKAREEISVQAQVFNTQRVRMVQDINKLNDKCEIAKDTLKGLAIPDLCRVCGKRNSHGCKQEDCFVQEVYRALKQMEGING